MGQSQETIHGDMDFQQNDVVTLNRDQAQPSALLYNNSVKSIDEHMKIQAEMLEMQ